MQKFLFPILFLLSLSCFSQNIIKIMHYNLLNYGNYTDYCTPNNNNVEDKDQYLQTIINYINPDIFTVNEISKYPYYHNRILNEVMNKNGRDYYSRAESFNYANSSIVNMLYYDNRKFALQSQDVVQTLLRDIDIYKLYYKDPTLALHKDTAFLICIVAHLKAGSNSTDEQKRAQMTSNLMNYLNNTGASDNYVLMGDFNVYSSNELAMQNVLAHSNQNICFYDPINMLGNWHNNLYYAMHHTQSTHDNTAMCSVSGGLDDRFDFILLSANVLNGIDHYSYINNSYQALGQDGNRFNSSIISPSNGSVPYNIANALYNMSDHLPVILTLQVDQENIGTNAIAKINCKYNNPVENILYLSVEKTTQVSLIIYNALGQKVLISENMLLITEEKNSINLEHLNSGIYFLHLKTTTKQRIYKLIKK